MRDLTWRSPADAVKLIVSGATFHATWKIALVVGTLLSVVNQWGPMMDDPGSWATWLRIFFNYLIPYIVSSIGYLAAFRERSI